MHRPIPRRTFLRASGVALALPYLESMNRSISAGGVKEAAPPKRLLAIGVPFGFDPEAFVPSSVGENYELTPHLQILKEHRKDFTIISGLSHPNTGGGGHKAEAVMLTGAPYPDYSHNLKNTISLDQQFAAQFLGETRYASFVLSTYYGSLSCTSNGVSIPPVTHPSKIYKKLFLASTPKQAEAEMKRLDSGRSLLDAVADQAQRLNRRVGRADQRRIDEYFTSVREVERQLQMARAWVNRPKPEPIGKPPKDIPNNALQAKKLQLMMEMTSLAFMTDSTRAVTIKSFGMHHDLSHHGKEPDKLAKCRAVEQDMLRTLGQLLTKLKSSTDSDGSPLLNQTTILLTSNLRDGNTHWTHDLPVLLAGGGFKHGRHITFNPEYVESLRPQPETGNQQPAGQKKSAVKPQMGRNQEPLCNLFTSILQNAGIPIDRFGSATGTLTGLT